MRGTRAGALLARVRVDFKSLTLAACTALGWSADAAAADAIAPVDYRDRNATYAPSASVPVTKEAPSPNRRVQDKRVEPATVEKQLSPVGQRASGVEVKEERPKEVRDKAARRPEVREHTTSPLNQQPAAISTGANTSKPPKVAKYQDSLAAASATNMARFPALDGATTAKINRFVFRKNPQEPAAAVSGSPIVPAAGGGVPR